MLLLQGYRLRNGCCVARQGSGCLPPSWCTTAAAAEVWGLHKAVAQAAFTHLLRTDCQSLLTTAAAGTASATAASRPLARIWNLIACSLDGDIATLTRERRIAWLPAHQPLCSIGCRTLSNGQLLTGADWRANRLVDALAKKAAATAQAPRAIIRLLESARAAAKHAAALLGVVTHAAHNCSVPVQRPDGSWGTTTRRDAKQPEDRSKQSHSQVTSALVLPAPSSLVATPGQADAPDIGQGGLVTQRERVIAPDLARVTHKRKMVANEIAKRRKLEDEALMRRRVEDVASLAVPASGPLDSARPTASERLGGVRQRVLTRLAGRAT